MEAVPEMPDAWNWCEVHGYDGDIMDILFMFTDTEQKIKFESKTDAKGQPVAKITPRNKIDHGNGEFKKVLEKVVEDCPCAEILFY